MIARTHRSTSVPVDLRRLAGRLHTAAEAAARSFGAPARFVLFLSATDGGSRAVTVNAGGASFAEAWRECVESLADRCPLARWIRVDWVEEVTPTTFGELRDRLAATKRNYFRQGIALDEDFRHAFLETELNANAMLYGGNTIHHAVVNERNFNRYARTRFGMKAVDFAHDAPVWLFRTGGLFCDAGEAAPVVLHAEGRNIGRRDIGRLTVAQLDAIIGAGADYLTRQVGPDGRFVYGCHPCFDRPIPTYNGLRHASTLYAMLEAYEVLPSASLRAAIERATSYLVAHLVRRVPANDRALAFVVEADGEIKLGASGVCLIALVKHAELIDRDRHRDLLEELGNGILHMQDPASGSFTHVLRYPSLETKQAFRIIYYDGEAAFGLMRLYALTRDPRWLEAVTRAFGHFQRQRHWQAHDHWMGYCTAELVAHRPSEAHFRFGLRNFRSHLDFVLERITTFPTLLELMNSAERLHARLEATPAVHHLLGEVDAPSLYDALHFRAHYLLNGHFWPELAMFFARPDKIAGSFFIRHHAFRVRIDDVEHYLSGLIGYRRFLLERGARHPADPARIAWRDRRETGWNARNLPLATGGTWHVPPPKNWKATGVFIHPGGFIPGRIAAVRLRTGEKGVAPRDLEADPVKPAAVLCSDPAQIGMDVRKLWVENPQAAVTAMARYARARFTGRVIGVTGSAGKTTTVALMAHALRAFGLVGHTGHNANLPLGVAWNCASMRWDDPHIVFELGVGRMAQSAALARPDVAIFTNILPAHLEYHGTLKNIAIRKSRLFLGMTRGAVAVLNRQMEEWETVHAAALQRGLKICHYGESEGCDVRLLRYDAESASVVADVHGTREQFALGAGGRHMALNALAVIAAATALGHPVGPVLAQISTYRPLDGRGTREEVTIEGKTVLVIDESYNANPGSMRAALALLGETRPVGRRVAVLGEMAELGPDAEAYHTALAPLIAANGIDRVFVAGKLFDRFWSETDPGRKGAQVGSIAELEAAIRADVAEGDCLLLKGSHSTGIWKMAQAWQKTNVEARTSSYSDRGSACL